MIRFEFKLMIAGLLLMVLTNTGIANDDFRFFDFVARNKEIKVFSPNNTTTNLFIEKVRNHFRSKRVTLKVITQGKTVLIYLNNYADLNIIKIDEIKNNHSDFILIGEVTDHAGKIVLLSPKESNAINNSAIVNVEYSVANIPYFLYRNLGRTSCGEYSECFQVSSKGTKQIALGTFRGLENSKLHLLKNFQKIVSLSKEGLIQRDDILSFDYIFAETNPSSNHFEEIAIQQSCGDMESLEHEAAALDFSFHFFSKTREGSYFLNQVFPSSLVINKLTEVHFSSNSHKLNPLELYRIKVLKAKTLEGVKNLKLTGQADTTGPSEKYNQWLAKRRANAVIKALLVSEDTDKGNIAKLKIGIDTKTHSDCRYKTWTNDRRVSIESNN